MKLYTFPFSSNARKAHMAVLLLGVPCETVTVDLGKGEQRKPEFLAINPMGRVPVLDDGGFILWESQAIMSYLADTKQLGTPLYPTEVRARADVNRWLFWTANHLSPAAGALNFERSIKPRFKLGDPDPAQVKRQEDALQALCTVLDAHLAKREWVSGTSMTFGDVSIACTLMTVEQAKAPLGGYPHVQSWWSRLKGLDAWKKTEPPRLG